MFSSTPRFLEIESSGRRKELRFHYSHMNQVRTETFPYLLADGRWHQLALYLSGDSVALYVDCQRIYKRVIPAPDRTWRGGGAAAGGSTSGSDDTLHLFLGQRNSQHALFRVSMGLFRCLSSVNCPTRLHAKVMIRLSLDEFKFITTRKHRLWRLTHCRII